MRTRRVPQSAQDPTPFSGSFLCVCLCVTGFYEFYAQAGCTAGIAWRDVKRDRPKPLGKHSILVARKFNRELVYGGVSKKWYTISVEGHGFVFALKTGTSSTCGLVFRIGTKSTYTYVDRRLVLLMFIINCTCILQRSKIIIILLFLLAWYQEFVFGTQCTCT